MIVFSSKWARLRANLLKILVSICRSKQCERFALYNSGMGLVYRARDPRLRLDASRMLRCRESAPPAPVGQIAPLLRTHPPERYPAFASLRMKGTRGAVTKRFVSKYLKFKLRHSSNCTVVPAGRAVSVASFRKAARRAARLRTRRSIGASDRQ
jgi:hypothetical protein